MRWGEDALERVRDGGTVLDPEVVAQLLARRRRGDPLDALSPREREVLGCLAEGRSNKQIAGALGISVRTVTVHVSNLLRKTGAASRTEAALWAVQRDAGARTG